MEVHWLSGGSDKDGGGNIDEDECLEILYRRYGKRAMEKLQDKLLKMFGRELDYGIVAARAHVRVRVPCFTDNAVLIVGGLYTNLTPTRQCVTAGEFLELVGSNVDGGGKMQVCASVLCKARQAPHFLRTRGLRLVRGVRLARAQAGCVSE